MIQNDSKCVNAASLKFMLIVPMMSSFLNVCSGPHTYNKFTDMNKSMMA